MHEFSYMAMMQILHLLRMAFRRIRYTTMQSILLPSLLQIDEYVILPLALVSETRWKELITKKVCRLERPLNAQ